MQSLDSVLASISRVILQRWAASLSDCMNMILHTTGAALSTGPRVQ